MTVNQSVYCGLGVSANFLCELIITNYLPL